MSIDSNPETNKSIVTALQAKGVPDAQINAAWHLALRHVQLTSEGAIAAIHDLTGTPLLAPQSGGEPMIKASDLVEHMVREFPVIFDRMQTPSPASSLPTPSNLTETCLALRAQERANRTVPVHPIPADKLDTMTLTELMIAAGKGDTGAARKLREGQR